MSFLTEYFDEYRPHPIRKTKIVFVGEGKLPSPLGHPGESWEKGSCRPEDRWAKLEGKWLDPKVGKQDKAWTEEEIEAFIGETMKRLRGQSTYYNDYCADLSPEFKTRPFVPRVKKLRPCKPKPKEEVKEVEMASQEQGSKLAMKDTELMKVAKDLYERDLDAPTLEPLPTHLRILGYVRPNLYKTGISDYQSGIAQVAYEMIRDDRIPRYYAHNGSRPRWGLPPDGIRQPELDIAPYESERLF